MQITNTLNSLYKDTQQHYSPKYPAIVLSLMMLLLPAVGVPNELIVQDSLKSAIAAFAALIAALLFFLPKQHTTTRLQWHGLTWLPVALMFYALGSMIWSHTYLAGVEAIRWFIFSLIFWLGLNVFSRENIPLLMWGIHCGALVAAIWGGLQFWLDFSLFPQLVPPSSTFINHNFFAEYMVCALPFSVWALANMRPSYLTILVSLSVALNIVAILMTGARGATISMLIIIPILIAIIIMHRKHLPLGKWRTPMKILVSLVLIMGVVGMSLLPGKINNGASAMQISFLRTASAMELREYTQGSFSTRTEMWKSTSQMILANKLFGLGAGDWEVAVPLYQPAEKFMEEDYYAHNEFLQLVSEYGLPVGGFFLAILFAYLLKTAEITWKSKEPDVAQEFILRSFTLTSLLALFIVSCVGFPWHMASTCALFAICLSLLAGSDRRLNLRAAFFATEINWLPYFSKVALIFLISSILLAVYITTQAARAEYKIMQSLLMGISAKKLREKGEDLSLENKALIIFNMQEAMDINPHYRKLTVLVAGQLVESGDWENAVWIWTNTVKSRPYLPYLWIALARGHTQLGHYPQALQAAKTALQLQPNSAGMHALEVNVLSASGDDEQAKKIVMRRFEDGLYDYPLTQSGYALGLKTHDWALAIRSLELRNKKWPDKAADGYFRLGNIYIETHDDAKAVETFKAGLQAVPEDEKDKFKNQVPEPYRNKL